jgi:nicotinamidase-related amidase
MASFSTSRAHVAEAPPTFGPDTALLVVDMQRDFMDADRQHGEGPVPVVGARARVPLVSQLMAAAAAAGTAVVASRDWHPPDHVSFVSSHPGGSKRPGDALQVEVGGKPLLVSLFRPHCVAGTAGAEFAGPPRPLHCCYCCCKQEGRQAGRSAGARPCIQP